MGAAQRLAHNRSVCFQGPVKVGAFDIDGKMAREWLTEPANPNGRTNADVVRPHINARNLTQRSADGWIIDFASMSETQAAFYSKPFGHVVLYVKPERDNNRDPQRKTRWWQFGRSSAALRSALSGA